LGDKRTLYESFIRKTKTEPSGRPVSRWYEDNKMTYSTMWGC
jgi:hypothetical protein